MLSQICHSRGRLTTEYFHPKLVCPRFPVLPSRSARVFSFPKGLVQVNPIALIRSLLPSCPVDCRPRAFSLVWKHRNMLYFFLPVVTTIMPHGFVALACFLLLTSRFPEASFRKRHRCHSAFLSFLPFPFSFARNSILCIAPNFIDLYHPGPIPPKLFCHCLERILPLLAPSFFAIQLFFFLLSFFCRTYCFSPRWRRPAF